MRQRRPACSTTTPGTRRCSMSRPVGAEASSYLNRTRVLKRQSAEHDCSKMTIVISAVFGALPSGRRLVVHKAADRTSDGDPAERLVLLEIGLGIAGQLETGDQRAGDCGLQVGHPIRQIGGDLR